MLKKFNSWLKVYFGMQYENHLQFTPRTIVINQRPYLISQVTEVEVPELVEIERLIYHIPPWDETAFYYDLHRPNCLYLVAKDHDTVLAYAGMAVNYAAKDAHLTNVATHPAFQQRGLASALLRSLMQVAIGQHLLTMSLEVRASNLTAQHLYEHFGFKIQGTRYHYYIEDGEDAYTMVNNLKLKGY